MEPLKLTADQFERMAKLVHARTGIHMPPNKQGMLSSRLRRRLKALGLESFDDYCGLLLDDSQCEEELPNFLSAVTTNETYFFRSERLWRHFTTELIPYWAESKPEDGRSLRLWSAASSSGEEAYTAAIALRERLPDFANWQIAIIGSDISKRVLDRARAAVYDDYAVSRMPEAQVRRWFDSTDGRHRLRDEIRGMAAFQFHDLRDEFPCGRFDLVLLRNVLMYFDADMKKRVLQVVSNAVAPGGHLIVGDVNPIRTMPELSACTKLQYLRPGTYRKPVRAADSGARALVKA